VRRCAALAVASTRGERRLLLLLQQLLLQLLLLQLLLQLLHLCHV